MTQYELLAAVSRAVSIVEGFEVTEAQAKARGIAFPTLPQRLANPGDIRSWKHNGVAYPTQGGYVDFIAWARGQGSAQPEIDGLGEGLRVLNVLVSQYIAGQYTGGNPPTLIQMFAKYAPAADGNNPGSYTRTVAELVGIPADVALKSLAS